MVLAGSMDNPARAPFRSGYWDRTVGNEETACAFPLLPPIELPTAISLDFKHQDFFGLVATLAIHLSRVNRLQIATSGRFRDFHLHRKLCLGIINSQKTVFDLPRKILTANSGRVLFKRCHGSAEHNAEDDVAG